ncbi:unnamed protein product, partial [marine sediment metagenome]
GERLDPFPSDNNIQKAKDLYMKLLKEIAALRAEIKTVKGDLKEKMSVSIASKLREYGEAVFEYGRLKNRRRRINVRELRKRMHATVPYELK